MTGEDIFSDSSPPHARHWLARTLSWKLWLPVAALLLAATGALMYRESRLAAIPDIGEPFDVEEFCQLSVEPAENAWLDYEAADALLVSTPHVKWEEIEATLGGNWSDATPAVRQWLADNQPALQRWRAGTAKDRSLRVPPAEATIESFAGGIEGQRTLMHLAQLESVRREGEGDLPGAWDCVRSLFRYSRHIGMYDTAIQRSIGIAGHQHAVTAACRWASRDDVTSEQLQKALENVRADYGMTTPLSAMIKFEYLIAIEISSQLEVLREAQAWGKTFGNAERGPLPRPVLFLMHEPEVSRRLLQHQVANLLQQIDEPSNSRPRVVHDLTYFDSPALPGSGILSPAEFESESARAAFSDVLLLKHMPIANTVREQSLQAALEVTLAAQRYRREFRELPERLSELVVAGFLPRIPMDPWGAPGAELRYERD